MKENAQEKTEKKHVTCERKRKRRNEMNDDNSSLSPATRDTRVICGWVTQIDIVISFSVAELLSHAYYMVDLDLIWPFHSTETQLSYSIWSSFNFSVPQNDVCRLLFFDFYLFEKMGPDIWRIPNPIFNMFWFFSLIDHDLLWKLKPMYSDFFLRLCFLTCPDWKENN